MCTVTFLPTQSGYVVAMNRDDLFIRSHTRGPEVRQTGTRTTIYPSEQTGGTWIGANDAGITLCLLNWARPGGPKLRSRGEVIPTLLASGTRQQLSAQLTAMPLEGILPFRLIAFSLRDRSIEEWRWDGEHLLSPLDFPWQLNHWFSSGLSDEQAREQRSRICTTALSDSDKFSTEWLRRLHRSHEPEAGPFSICAHRETAGTLSYTEICFQPQQLEVRYTDSSPCKVKPPSLATLNATFPDHADV